MPCDTGTAPLSTMRRVAWLLLAATGVEPYQFSTRSCRNTLFHRSNRISLQAPVDVSNEKAVRNRQTNSKRPSITPMRPPSASLRLPAKDSASLPPHQLSRTLGFAISKVK